MKLLITACLLAVIASATVSYKKIGDSANSCMDVTFDEAECQGNTNSEPLKEVLLSLDNDWEAGVCGDDFSKEACDVEHQEMLHDMADSIEELAGFLCTEGNKPDYKLGCKVDNKAAPVNSDCPASDFEKLDCEPKTCANWKVAFHEFGCAHEVSECVKDYLQGELECQSNGKNLDPSSSMNHCDDNTPCTLEGEFCNFGKSSLHDGTCELCKHTFCDHLEDAGRTACLSICGGDKCDPNPECDDSCGREPKTCAQLKLAMQKGGCGAECNQCHINLFNEKLKCSGEDYVYSLVDPDSSASVFSLMMLAFVAIYQF